MPHNLLARLRVRAMLRVVTDHWLALRIVGLHRRWFPRVTLTARAELLDALPTKPSRHHDALHVLCPDISGVIHAGISSHPANRAS